MKKERLSYSLPVKIIIFAVLTACSSHNAKMSDKVWLRFQNARDSINNFQGVYPARIENVCPEAEKYNLERRSGDSLGYVDLSPMQTKAFIRWIDEGGIKMLKPGQILYVQLDNGKHYMLLALLSNGKTRCNYDADLPDFYIQSCSTFTGVEPRKESVPHYDSFGQSAKKSK